MHKLCHSQHCFIIGRIIKIYFDSQFGVLNEDTYTGRAEEIEGLYALMTSLR